MSVLRYIPRFDAASRTFPRAATPVIFAPSRMLPMPPPAGAAQVLPSVVSNTPLRGPPRAVARVPAVLSELKRPRPAINVVWFPSVGSNFRAPTESELLASVWGVQVVPPSVDSQMPPFTAPR